MSKVDSMDLLQKSLMDIENESSVTKQRTSKVTVIPSVFDDLANHKTGKKGQANAVVQALTSVILERGGDTIPTSYFALLFGSFNKSTEDEELDVILYILRLLLPVMSVPVLTAKFNDLATLFQGILNAKYESSLIVVNVSLITFDLSFIVY